MITLKSHFCHKNVIILSLCTQQNYGRHYVSEKSVNHLWFISFIAWSYLLPDSTPYDKIIITKFVQLILNLGVSMYNQCFPPPLLHVSIYNKSPQNNKRYYYPDSMF